jgi:hypothetical protein
MTQLLETVPTEWSDADERFFAVVVRLLPAEFLLGATVLLMSYDDETEPAAPSGPGQMPSAASVPSFAVQARQR